MEEQPDYNILFDEIYRNYACENVTIAAINDHHTGKNIVANKQTANEPVKCDELLNEWLPAVAPQKAMYLEKMIADFKAIGLLDEHASEGFLDSFEDLRNEVETFENIQESLFITAFFVDNSSKCFDLQVYVFYQPFRFDVIFDKYFLPLLSAKGITDITVEQDTYEDGDDQYTYHVRIRSANASYEFREHGAQDLITPFVLAINRILTGKPGRERFVRIVDSDLGFAFFEPNEVLPCFSKYGFRVKAINIYN